MKRILIMLLCFMCIFTSCDKEETTTNNKQEDSYANKSGETTCVLEYDESTLKLKGTYIITYENGYTTKIYTREVATLSSDDAANTYESTIKQEYSKYVDVEYYNYDVTRSGNKITSSSSIDYKQIDLEKLSTAIGKTMTKEDTKYLNMLGAYKVMGATCSEE